MAPTSKPDLPTPRVPAPRLVVTEPFGRFERFDRIEDPAEVEAALASHPAHVVREAPPEEMPGGPDAAPALPAGMPPPPAAAPPARRRS